MEFFRIVAGFLVLFNIAAALVTAFGKKHLKRTVVRLDLLREERRVKMTLVIKRRKSADKTLIYLRGRKGEIMEALVKGKEEVERYEQEGEEGGEDEDVQGEENGDGEGRKEKEISSWVDKVDAEHEGSLPKDKDIKTKFPASEGEENLFK